MSIPARIACTPASRAIGRWPRPSTSLCSMTLHRPPADDSSRHIRSGSFTDRKPRGIPVTGQLRANSRQRPPRGITVSVMDGGHRKDQGRSSIDFVAVARVAAAPCCGAESATVRNGFATRALDAQLECGDAPESGSDRVAILPRSVEARNVRGSRPERSRPVSHTTPPRGPGGWRVPTPRVGRGARRGWAPRHPLGR